MRGDKAMPRSRLWSGTLIIIMQSKDRFWHMHALSLYFHICTWKSLLRISHLTCHFPRFKMPFFKWKKKFFKTNTVELILLTLNQLKVPDSNRPFFNNIHCWFQPWNHNLDIIISTAINSRSNSIFGQHQQCYINNKVLSVLFNTSIVTVVNHCCLFRRPASNYLEYFVGHHHDLFIHSIIHIVIDSNNIIITSSSSHHHHYHHHN